MVTVVMVTVVMVTVVMATVLGAAALALTLCACLLWGGGGSGLCAAVLEGVVRHTSPLPLPQGIQSLAASLEKRGQDKERKKAAAPQVSTEATFQPSVTRRGRSKSPPSTQAPTITSQSKPERWNPKVAVEYPLPTSQPASTAVRAREQVARETVSQPMTHAQPPPPQPTATGGEDKGPPVPPHARGSALGSRGDKERERTESERRERERREREREEREREERERERREREERERERREREERERERREREEKEERERREREKMEKEREKREKEKIEEERERRERELRRAAEAEVVLRRRDKKVPKPDSQKAMIVPGPSAPVSLENVPLRKKKTKDVPAGLEPQGHIADMPSGYRQLNPAPMPPSLPLSDLASQEAACKGLPNSGKGVCVAHVCRIDPPSLSPTSLLPSLPLSLSLSPFLLFSLPPSLSPTILLPFPPSLPPSPPTLSSAGLEGGGRGCMATTIKPHPLPTLLGLLHSP